MAEITDVELAEYQQLKAIRQAQASASEGGDVSPDKLVPSRAMLASGNKYDYIGAHPTHVDTGAGVVPVIGWYNL